jgi:hypothetical protein
MNPEDWNKMIYKLNNSNQPSLNGDPSLINKQDDILHQKVDSIIRMLSK